MDRMLYLAMTGAKHAMQNQQQVSHNLANANTTGFRADFQALLQAPVSGPGHDSRAYSELATTGSDLSQGAMLNTGRQLDVAIQGEGWIAVQAPDGTEAYTRRGDFHINPNGLLETGDGNLVLGEGGPVAVPPAQKVEIGQDGTLSVVPLGQAANTLAVVDRIKLVQPDNAAMGKGEDGLFRHASGEPQPADANVRVNTGMLESSNVNLVDGLVQMIDNARRYEAYVKLMSEAKSNDEQAQRLLRNS
ncbi:flagellar basal-body rod protein FlgF [Alkalilimnicola sp. S0819]|uniref:flagellar basal-body rod protein FlgF n=1 Tax=Alkalilimnicola sp. S0819 TaxID=2613922 RepID=UPI001261B3AE|nr:flagellar basal-body rod protein FlgF [Alkalilimnicola sp. S0819]KAB7627197.1 flagellar basal-body rod protein FlgF [Alkalilimnicola sp. S0819]MPQ15910.1 flagellar basal-body rod protein FlgF [Alkalilimnicola sp. S0819]